MSVTITAPFQYEIHLIEKGISSFTAFGVTYWPTSLGNHLRKHWAAIQIPATIVDTANANTPLSCTDEKLFVDAVASYIATRTAQQQENDAAWTAEVTRSLSTLPALTDLANCLRLMSAQVKSKGIGSAFRVEHNEWVMSRQYAREPGLFTLQDAQMYQVIHSPTGVVIEIPSHLAQQFFRFIRDEHHSRNEVLEDFEPENRQAA